MTILRHLLSACLFAVFTTSSPAFAQETKQKEIASISVDNPGNPLCVQLRVTDRVTGKTKVSTSGLCKFAKKTKKPAAKPTSPPASAPTVPVGPPTITIEVNLEEWKKLKADLEKLQQDLAAMGSTALLESRIEKLEKQLGQQPSGAKSVEERLTYLLKLYGDLDDRLTEVEKRLDKVEDDVDGLGSRVTALEQDGGDGVGHQLSLFYGLSKDLVQGANPSPIDHLLGVELRFGLNQKVGIHGSVAAAPRLSGWPDVQWGVGFDFGVSPLAVITAGFEATHKAVSPLDLSVSGIQLAVVGGAELKIFKGLGLRNTSLMLQLNAGLESDNSPAPFIGGFIGLSHALWAKQPKSAGKPAVK